MDFSPDFAGFRMTEKRSAKKYDQKKRLSQKQIRGSLFFWYAGSLSYDA